MSINNRVFSKAMTHDSTVGINNQARSKCMCNCPVSGEHKQCGTNRTGRMPVIKTARVI